MRERKTVKEYNTEKTAKDKDKEKAAIEGKKDAQAIANTFATEDGRRCLLLLMKRMKYQSPISATADGVIHQDNLVHNAALQGLYLWLRKYIDKPTLIAVEVEGLEESKEK